MGEICRSVVFGTAVSQGLSRGGCSEQAWCMSVGLWGARSFGVNPGCFGMSDKETGFCGSLVITLSLQLARMEKSLSQLLMGCSHWRGTAPGSRQSHFWDPRFVKSQLARLASSTMLS